VTTGAKLPASPHGTDVADRSGMRILIVGPWEDWVTTNYDSFELRSAAGAGEAIEQMIEWKPELAIVDPMIIGPSRDALSATAESLGIRVIGARGPAVRIPGSTIEEIEKHAILETLKAVGGSTSRAAKLLGISARKIQYRLRDWRTSKPEEQRHASH
jgi:hypothetical protein